MRLRSQNPSDQLRPTKNSGGEIFAAYFVRVIVARARSVNVK
jgi:hypothetical protein